MVVPCLCSEQGCRCTRRENRGNAHSPVRSISHKLRSITRSWRVGRPTCTATLTDMIVTCLYHIALYHLHGRTNVNSLSFSSIQRFSFVVNSEEYSSLQRFRLTLVTAWQFPLSGSRTLGDAASVLGSRTNPELTRAWTNNHTCYTSDHLAARGVVFHCYRNKKCHRLS